MTAALPAWLSQGSEAGTIPRRSLGLTVSLGLAGFAIVAATGVGTAPLVLATTGSFVAVYAVGVAAAVRLLPRRSIGWWTAIVALATVIVMTATTGPYLIWPVAVGAIALLYLRHAPRNG
jgi:amino acid efflux transporter